MKIRIGNGFDVHALVENVKLIIGGVTIPYSKGLAGHSDADVLLHAICDACLGAAALGDIGKHFPDTDSAYQGADSRELLRHVNQLLHECGYKLINIDSTIVAQAPKMSPYIEQMRNNIAQDLNLEVNDVNVKATTTEKLGFQGKGEGVSAYASVLIQAL